MTAPIFIILTDEVGLDVLINVKAIKGAYTEEGKHYLVDKNMEQIVVEESPREIYNLIQAASVVKAQ